MDMTMCCTVTANLNSVDTDQRIAVDSLQVLADNLCFFNHIVTKQPKELTFSFLFSNMLVSKLYPVSHHYDEDLKRANIFLGYIK